MSILSLAVIKLSLVALFGFYLYRKKVIVETTLQFLAFFVINFSIPFLIFSHLIENSKAVLNHSLWIFIVLSVSIFFIGYLLGFIALSGRNCKFKGEFLSIVSFQNAGYLPMNIAFFLFPPQVRDKFLIYIFLYLLGFNIIMWSLGSFFIFRKRGEKFDLRGIFTPPVISTIVALLLVWTRVAKFIPSIVISPMKMIGEVSFVLSMIILGCWLAKVELKRMPNRLYLIAGAGLKLIILPLLFLIGLINFKIFSLLGVFIILQAAMPSAVSLPIIVNLRGADSEFTSQGVFLTHILSIFTIPVWLGLYLKLSGYSL